MSGLVCMLPHGYEGQGPEHSSARLERFLQMCAEDNMQVVYATTPANFFHVLRRQLHREIRKPLILMTPKSLLRHKRAVSRLDELGSGTTFHRILYDDAVMLPDEKIKGWCRTTRSAAVVLCSGKVYYDLYEEREKARHRRRLPDADRAALSGTAEGAGAGARTLPECRGGMVSGRAAQHGRVAFHRAPISNGC